MSQKVCLLGLVVLVSAWGCNKENKQDAAGSPVTQQEVRYDPDPALFAVSDSAAAPVEEDAGSDVETAVAYEPAPGEAQPLAASEGEVGGRNHTVRKGDTLFALARHYYNDASRWKEIYQANRTKLGDPNRLLVGQKLVIP